MEFSTNIPRSDWALWKGLSSGTFSGFISLLPWQQRSGCRPRQHVSEDSRGVPVFLFPQDFFTGGLFLALSGAWGHPLTGTPNISERQHQQRGRGRGQPAEAETTEAPADTEAELLCNSTFKVWSKGGFSLGAISKNGTGLQFVFNHQRWYLPPPGGRDGHCTPQPGIYSFHSTQQVWLMRKTSLKNTEWSILLTIFHFLYCAQCYMWLTLTRKRKRRQTCSTCNSK